VVGDLVDLHRERLGDIVAHQLEPVVVEQVLDVRAGSGEEIVEADHLVPFLEQPLAEVRSQEPRSSRDENAPS
jgi:hypothetical protein